MTTYSDTCESLRARPRTFLVTGVAGFIGSHLLETLLDLGQSVVGLDNFATGSRDNIRDVLARVGAAPASLFRMIEGDVRDPSVCDAALSGADIVLHQAALASVPRSMLDPMSTHTVNVNGFLNVLQGARAAGIERIVYASSSSVYGDDSSDVKAEDHIGRPLSPYAATKVMNEIYAGTFYRTQGVSSVGLRYFNVFGPRQDPAGPYAAVIPRWIEALLRNRPCTIFGDGSASRDFCFVDDVVQANLLAACAPDVLVGQALFNVGGGVRTTLLQLFVTIRSGVALYASRAKEAEPLFDLPRLGDVPHSLASIERARTVLGYEPSHGVPRGIQETIPWYAAQRMRAPDTDGLRLDLALQHT